MSGRCIRSKVHTLPHRQTYRQTDMMFFSEARLMCIYSVFRHLVLCMGRVSGHGYLHLLQKTHGQALMMSSNKAQVTGTAFQGPCCLCVGSASFYTCMHTQVDFTSVPYGCGCNSSPLLMQVTRTGRTNERMALKYPLEGTSCHSGTLRCVRSRSVALQVGGSGDELQQGLMEVCQAIITHTPSSPPPAGHEEN